MDRAWRLSCERARTALTQAGALLAGVAARCIGDDSYPEECLLGITEGNHEGVPLDVFWIQPIIQGYIVHMLWWQSLAELNNGSFATLYGWW